MVPASGALRKESRMAETGMAKPAGKTPLFFLWLRPVTRDGF